MRKILSSILLILFICIFVGSVSYLAYAKYQSIQQEKKIEELREKKLKEENKRRKELEEKEKTEKETTKKEEKEKQQTEEIELQEEQKEILDEYKSLYEENSDLAGWIKINDTVIDYPVMQTASGNDAMFYNHRDWNKNDSTEGTPFIDANCDLVSSNNIIIYAHNMKAGTMFGSLKKYKESEYLVEHPIINFDTLYEKNRYQIIGVLITQVYYDGNPNKEFEFYNNIDLSTEEEFNYYIKNVKEKSLYNINETAEFGDKLITLVTCHRMYKTDQSTRLLVVAKKI